MKKVLFHWLMAYCIPVFFLSCIFQPDFEALPASSQASSSTVITRKNYLALLKLQKEHTSSVEELEAIAAQVVQSGSNGRHTVSGGNAISGMEKIELSSKKQFIFPSRSATDTEEPAAIYAFTTESSNNTNGFILTCNDNRIGNVLAIVDEGNPLDTEDPFLKMIYANLEGYIDRTIAEYNSITDKDISQALNFVKDNNPGRVISTYSGDTEVETGQGEVIFYSASPGNGAIIFELFNDGLGGGDDSEFFMANFPHGLAEHFWEAPPPPPPGYGYRIILYSASWVWTDGHYATVPTEWNQGYAYTSPIYYNSNSPYNDIINHYGVVENVNHNQNNYLVVGCAPVAIAQLMAFHNYPAQCTIAGPYVNTPYNWAAMTASPAITPNSSAAAKTGVGVLLYEIGKRANSEYLNNVATGEEPLTGTWEGGIVKALREMGYTVPTVPITITANPRADGYFGPYNFSTIRTSIINQRPVLVVGYTAPDSASEINSNGTYGKGHAWIIDGVRNMIYQEIYKYEFYTGTSTNSNVILTLNRTFCNINFDAGQNWVHCNMGGDGENSSVTTNNKSNGWYLSGLFDAENVSFARSLREEFPYLQYHIKILPEIHY